MLVHLVELAPLEGDPVANYEAVRAELAAYGAGLERLPELVVLSKRDLLPPEEVGGASRSGASGWARTRWGCSPSPRRPARGWTSCARRSSPSCPSGARRRPRSAEPGGFEAEHRVYRPGGEGAST